jgi:uncharacterized membrane protein YbaN (DUF454 family)
MGGTNGWSWSGRVDAVEADGPWPRVASDESSGVIRVGDPRVFQAGGRAFCRLWLGAALCVPLVRKAGIDLATATALIEFEPGAVSTATMAEAFSEAVLEALTASPSGAAADRSDWVALVGFPGPDSSVWEVSRRSKNRLQLRLPAFDTSNPRRADQLAEADGVTGCRRAWFSDGLTVAFDPALTNEDRILEAVRSAWLDPIPAGTTLAIDSRARTANLVKAGGSFALTLVGLVVPGIPTVPFLLATSFYLARSSPRLNAILLDSPLFGTVLQEWETHQGLSPTSKGKLLGLSAAIVTVTLLVVPITPMALTMILLISLASVYGTLQLPGLPANEGDEPKQIPALTLALG